VPGLSFDELDRTVEAALAIQLTALRDLDDRQWHVVDR
jgi:hypothetical protein